MTIYILVSIARFWFSSRVVDQVKEFMDDKVLKLNSYLEHKKVEFLSTNRFPGSHVSKILLNSNQDYK